VDCYPRSSSRLLRKDKAMTTQQIDYWTGQPHPVCNRYVPANAEIIGQVSYGSGELIYTYYCIRNDHQWAFFKIADWIDSKPVPTNMAEIEANGLIPQWVLDERTEADSRSAERHQWREYVS
jgi:hypothetical protein